MFLKKCLFSFRSGVSSRNPRKPSLFSDDEKISSWSLDPAFASLQLKVRLVVLLAVFCDFILLTIIIPVTPVLLPEDTTAFYLVGILYASKPFLQVLCYLSRFFNFLWNSSGYLQSFHGKGRE